jgi:UPF0042 nucleotide-binding protein
MARKKAARRAPRHGSTRATAKAARELRSQRSLETRKARKASLALTLVKGDGRFSRSRAGQPFIILTGLSGSGKSQAIRALEDLGYFCVDNLPTTLIPTLAKLSLRAGGDIEKVAIVVDVREGGFLSSFPKIFRQLRKMPKLNPVLIFLEADHAALVRRFSETRRPHPLAPDRSVTEGIRDERSRLNVIRDMADEIVDTSDMTVHELRQFFMGLSRDRTRARLVITVLSFGFKHGVPVDADLVFDVRCLPNPHFVPTLRRRTGRDKAVADFLERDESTRQFMDRLEEYVRYLVPFYVAEGKSYLTIAIGCTGGRHRSVMIAERLKRALGDVGVARVRVRHRDLALA